MKLLKSKENEFRLTIDTRPVIYLRSNIRPVLYSTVVKYSSGFLKLDTKQVLDTLNRIPDLNPGELELKDVIEQALKLAELESEDTVSILFRR